MMEAAGGGGGAGPTPKQGAGELLPRWRPGVGGVRAAGHFTYKVDQTPRGIVHCLTTPSCALAFSTRGPGHLRTGKRLRTFFKVQ